MDGMFSDGKFKNCGFQILFKTFKACLLNRDMIVIGVKINLPVIIPKRSYVHIKGFFQDSADILLWYQL